MEVSVLTKKRIEELAEKGQRLDGRKLLEFRPVSIEQGIIKMAEGSAHVKIGNTEVLAGVKIDVGPPFSDTPEDGALVVTAELWPLASERFELGPPGIQAIELARIVDRAIRESGFIELKKLCIRKSELVWTLFVDIYPINDDGNLIDAAALAAIAALKNAVFPVLVNDKVKYGEHTTKHLPLNDWPLTLTFYKVGKKFLLDPSSAEEEIASARITFAFTFEKDKEFIHAIQKAGSEALTEAELFEALEIAVAEGKKLIERFSQQIKK